jgi:hypothetical protein
LSEKETLTTDVITLEKLTFGLSFCEPHLVALVS